VEGAVSNADFLMMNVNNDILDAAKQKGFKGKYQGVERVGGKVFKGSAKSNKTNF